MRTKARSFLRSLSLVIAAGCILQATSHVHGRPLPLDSLVLNPKPDPKDAIATARWLVSENSWGVLNTIADDLGGAPFGNVVSFCDGPPNEGTGIPYFYLTTLDPTAQYALKDERASFTTSEYPVGTCGNRDPENPTCAKITLTGKLKMLNGNSEEAEFAQKSLFSRHPEMKDWPKDHDFRVFKLDIQNIFLIDWFGGPKPITLDEYLHPNRSRSRSTLELSH
ncbi:hypothetical protein MLD38_022495 [Melastoma candidum]|uniref:Uncharacterized protein n=1 Tax=Melastoma candidum TaxID=119954 RepID=A0ACB9QL91_9MYRT|nr:hypothetical protein MLD38_022495 [Melastoma candidum]